MGQKSKTSKGEISISNFQGRIRLRWRYAGERYSLNLPYAYLPENLHHGTVKATEIKLDILKGSFDPSLEKYKPSPIVKPEAIKTVEVPTTIEKIQSPSLLHDLVMYFNDWCANIRNVDIEIVGNAINPITIILRSVIIFSILNFFKNREQVIETFFFRKVEFKDVILRLNAEVNNLPALQAG